MVQVAGVVLVKRMMEVIQLNMVQVVVLGFIDKVWMVLAELVVTPWVRMVEMDLVVIMEDEVVQ